MSIDNETIIFIIISIPLLIVALFNAFKDTMDFDKLKLNIPKLINLAKRIEIINLNIKIQYWNDDQITNKKYILLKYIEELEPLQNVWEYFSSNSIINNSDIKCPYILAYNIRDILETPLTKDENNEDYVWLSEKEKSFIKLFQSIDFNKDNQEFQENQDIDENKDNIEKNDDLVVDNATKEKII